MLYPAPGEPAAGRIARARRVVRGRVAVGMRHAACSTRSAPPRARLAAAADQPPRAASATRRVPAPSPSSKAPRHRDAGDRTNPPRRALPGDRRGPDRRWPKRCPARSLPLIVRPVDSHAGRKASRRSSAARRARRSTWTRIRVEEFFISRFVDYRGGDGLFRKYRIVFINGMPYAGHMGVSAALDDPLPQRRHGRQRRRSGPRRKHFMRDLRHGLRPASRGRARQPLVERFGLDYLVIDCAETVAGE